MRKEERLETVTQGKETEAVRFLFSISTCSKSMTLKLWGNQSVLLDSGPGKQLDSSRYRKKMEAITGHLNLGKYGWHMEGNVEILSSESVLEVRKEKGVCLGDNGEQIVPTTPK